jgi:hypothetical protein
MLSIEALLVQLEESDKALTAAIPRDRIMQAQTGIFFNLGIRTPQLMKAGLEEYNQQMSQFRNQMTSLVSEFLKGKVTDEQARELWRQYTSDYYQRLFLAGAKAAGNPYYAEQGVTAKDSLFLTKARAYEERFFNRFLRDMKDPSFEPTMDFLDRAAAYAESGKAQFYNGLLAGAGDAVEIHWVMDNLAEHCGQCPILASRVWTWQTLPTTPGAGDTDCLFNCRCHLELQPAKDRDVQHFPMPGATTALPVETPGRWATVIGPPTPEAPNGVEIGGEMAAAIEDLYQQLYKARQMTMLTSGEERERWIALRQDINKAIIDHARGYRALPTVSVTQLEQVVNWARELGATRVISDLSTLRDGMEVVYMHANYWTKGVIERQGNVVVVKTPAGQKWPVNERTDILLSLEGVPVTESLEEGGPDTKGKRHRF